MYSNCIVVIKFCRGIFLSGYFCTIITCYRNFLTLIIKVKMLYSRGIFFHGILKFCRDILVLV